MYRGLFAFTFYLIKIFEQHLTYYFPHVKVAMAFAAIYPDRLITPGYAPVKLHLSICLPTVYLVDFRYSFRNGLYIGWDTRVANY